MQNFVKQQQQQTFYNKGMLDKVQMQRTQQFSDLSL